MARACAVLWSSFHIMIQMLAGLHFESPQDDPGASFKMLYRLILEDKRVMTPEYPDILGKMNPNTPFQFRLCHLWLAIRRAGNSIYIYNWSWVCSSQPSRPPTQREKVSATNHLEGLDTPRGAPKSPFCGISVGCHQSHYVQFTSYRMPPSYKLLCKPH